MDFGTVRKKLDGGLYSNLEELEVNSGFQTEILNMLLLLCLL